MKKLFLTSGVLTLVFGILFLSGIIDFNHTVSRALTAGNRQYTADSFTEALSSYETGLQKKPENQVLNYNAAQASYRVQAYEQANEFYGKAAGTVDRYLNQGNASLRLGDRTEDVNQKLQHYTSALETYQQGILSFPQSVELKYNYEYVRERIKALQDNMQNQQQNENQTDQENQDQNQQQGGGQGNQNDNNQGQQNNQQDNSGNEGDSQENQQGDEGSEDNPSEGQENEQQNPEDQQQGASGQDEQQNPEDPQSEASGQDQQNEESQGQQAEPSPASDDDNNNEQTGSTAEGTVQNNSEIERILQMLEKQEEEALKNNQQIRDSGKEDEHDW